MTLDAADLALLDVDPNLTPTERRLLDEVRWYRGRLMKVAWILESFDHYEEAKHLLDSLDLGGL